MKVEFTVARDAEAKKLKDVEKVTFECTFDGVEPSIIQQHAIANMVVAWQSQIRNNWKEFLKGELPKTVTFGQTLFSGRKPAVSRPPTEQEIRDFTAKKIAAMTPEQLAEFVQTGRFPEDV